MLLKLFVNQTREEEAEEKKEDCADRRQPSEDSGRQSSRTCNPATKKLHQKHNPWIRDYIKL